jgi:D-alanyl-D-alanine carboxypeptidase
MIDIKARASEYLGHEAWFRALPNSGEITVEMLLNHTAGIPEYVYNPELWKQVQQYPDKVWTVEERFSFIRNQPAVNQPGKAWSYADSHYLILGAIIEKVSGKDYYAMLTEDILQPCHLQNTSPSDKRNLSGLVAGYTEMPAEFLLPHKMLIDNKYAFNPQLEWTGGGLITNVSDLASWAQQLYGGKVLKPETLQLMLTPSKHKTTLFEEAGYGMGCFVGQTNGVTYYGHTGFCPGYITYLQYLPDSGIAFAFQFNNDGSHGDFSMKEFFNELKTIVLQNQ